MDTVSLKTDERARKIVTTILQALAEKGQVVVSKETNISETTISRWKTEDLEKAAKILVSVGYKVVPETSLEVSNTELLSLKTLAKKYLEIDVGD